LTGEELTKLRRDLRLTQEDMAERLNISRAYINRLESGKAMISDNIVLRINAIFAATPVAEIPKTLIPYVNIDITASPMSLFENPLSFPHTNLDLPGFQGSTLAINIAGDNMHPTVSPGSIVLCKEITDKSIIMYGEIFVVVTVDYRIVKRLKPSKKKGYVIAVSDNHTSHGDQDGIKSYSPVEIPIDKILKLYLVTGSIKRHQL
jgi:transcriptional regulator with XRE-family HTH domain